MAYQSKGGKPPGSSEAKKKRMRESAECKAIPLDMAMPRPEFKPFEQCIIGLYGVPGVGKSKFVEELGLHLQEKYRLDLPGVYMLQGEPVNHRWKIRGASMTHYLKTWPTFCKHVDDICASHELQQTVKMFAIDTADSVVPKILLKLCHDYGAESAGDQIEGGNIYSESQDELEYQVLKLLNLGIGVLILSHERGIAKKVGPVEVEQARMDLSPKMFNRVADRCSMVLHMRQTDRLAKAKQGTRCLVSLENDREHAKDNLGVILPSYSDGIIEFGTERQAVEQLLGCFGTGRKVSKKTAKKVTKKVSKKVSKKVVKKTSRR
ncbi:MAG: AAA family ATPase [Planctomycetes bacterium]|nr:AAA family ATPase [Planctomycetota bacterium]